MTVLLMISSDEQQQPRLQVFEEESCKATASDSVRRLRLPSY